MPAASNRTESIVPANAGSIEGRVNYARADNASSRGPQSGGPHVPEASA